MKNKSELKNIIIIILTIVFAYLIASNINIFINIIVKLFNVLLPFIIGIALAFILNIPVVKIESLLQKKIKNKNILRIISITLSVILFILILSFVLLLLVPELIENIELLIQNIPVLINKIENIVISLLDKYPDIQIEIENNFMENANISTIIVNILNYLLNSSVKLISGLISGLVTAFTSLIFAIYMLVQKEQLQTNLKNVIYAYLKKDYANKIMEIAKLSNKTFSKFITGQCTEAIILGLIFFIVLSIFKFPYALLISVLTAVTALIPIFGAMIAMTLGSILIAISNPLEALIFILVFLIIQQIEGNFIYPKVVGKSVGLSSLWTLFAITVGGGLFGVVGMLISLPIAAILSVIFTNDINKRLKKNKLGN